MRKTTKRAAAITATAAIAIGGLGAAAYANGWFVGGAGFAQGETSEVKALYADAYLAKKAYPGLSTHATAYIDNNNDFPVNINKITMGELEVTGTTGATCRSAILALAAKNINVFVPTLPAQTVKVNANTQDTTLSIPVAVSDELPLSCAASTIKLNFTLEGASTV
jgi:hypothetical protein